MWHPLTAHSPVKFSTTYKDLSLTVAAAVARVEYELLTELAAQMTVPAARLSLTRLYKDGGKNWAEVTISPGADAATAKAPAVADAFITLAKDATKPKWTGVALSQVDRASVAFVSETPTITGLAEEMAIGRENTTSVTDGSPSICAPER